MLRQAGNRGSVSGFQREKAILGLPSQSAHLPSLNTGAFGCLADYILGISDAVL